MITILGGSGNVGGKTADILLKAGHKVRLVARNEARLQPFRERGAEIALGSAIDGDFLAEAFNGSDAVLAMMPGDFRSDNIGAYQDKMGLAIIDAVIESGIKKLVFLSSVGGHTEQDTGIVAGLARQEVRLRSLEGVDIKILRPTYFMENFFGSIGMIRNMNLNGSNIRGDKPMPIIASKDIAEVAAGYLVDPLFEGISVRALLGPRNYTMQEATAILAKAVGKEGIPYVQFPPEDTKNAMMGMGMSASLADAMVGLGEGINKGVFDYEERNSETTTPTTLEEFSQIFAYVYNQ